MIDLNKLEELAKKAGSDAWEFDNAETPILIAGGEVVGGDALPYGDVYTMAEYEQLDEGGEPVSEPLTICSEIGVRYGRFVAAANPAVILELIKTQRELVEALKELDECYCEANTFLDKEDLHRHRMTLIKARSAIQKATGE